MMKIKSVTFTILLHYFFNIKLYGKPPEKCPPKEWPVLRCLYMSIVKPGETLFQTLSEMFLGLTFTEQKVEVGIT